MFDPLLQRYLIFMETYLYFFNIKETLYIDMKFRKYA